MELQQARYFLALSKSLNFTRAAQQCNVTQPGLTKAIQKLEQELDGVLIHRERQLTQLTDLGKLVLPMIERTVAAADSVQFHAREFQQKAVTPLRIVLESNISATIVVEPLTELVRTLPELRVEIIEARAERIPSLLLDGQANAAISGILDYASDRIDRWFMFEERIVVLTAIGSPLSRYDCIPEQALANAVWLEREGCQLSRRLWSAHPPSMREPKIVHHGEHDAHLQQLASAGLGVMLAPEHAPHLPSLVSRPIVGDPLRQRVELLAVAGRRYSPALDAFVKTCRLLEWPTAFRMRPGASQKVKMSHYETVSEQGTTDAANIRQDR